MKLETRTGPSSSPTLAYREAARAIEELTSALELLRALTANIPDTVIQIDLEERIVFANRGPAAPRAGTRLCELGPEYAEAASYVAAALEGPVEFDILVPDGSIVAYRAGPILHEGEIIGAVIIGRDVTLERQTQRELRTATTQLLQGQKLSAIGQLAAGIAHEINTPVQFVSDNTVFLQNAFERIQELLELASGLTPDQPASPALLDRFARAAGSPRMNKLKAQIPRAIAQSLEGLGRVSKLVSAMKEFSHPSHGTKELVELGRALETTATIARNEWKYVADLEIELEAGLPPIPLLRDEFNQVILNLIVNAAHAIDERYRGEKRGQILIVARLDGDKVEIRVSDDGTGIPKANRQKIFEPFFTTKPVGKGTGQGLAIAYSVIVEKHYGSMEVISEEGQGTTFVIRLPSNATTTSWSSTRGGYGGRDARPAGR